MLFWKKQVREHPPRRQGKPAPKFIGRDSSLTSIQQSTGPTRRLDLDQGCVVVSLGYRAGESPIFRATR